jgi:hypothetical protein
MPSGQEGRRWVLAVLLAGLMSAAGACTTGPPAPAPATVPPTTTTVPVDVATAISTVFGPRAPEATTIARCESGLRPTAVSPTDDHGLFQINILHRPDFVRVTGLPWSSIYDPLANTRYARWLHDRQGWAPWACRTALSP